MKILEFIVRVGKVFPWFSFWQMTHALGQKGYNQLRSEFVDWALPQLLEIESSIMKEIDPEVFDDLLELMMKTTDGGSH